MSPGSEARGEHAPMRPVAAQQMLAARLRGCRDWPWYMWLYLPMCSPHGFYHCLPRACGTPPGAFALRYSFRRHVSRSAQTSSSGARVRAWMRASAAHTQLTHLPWLPFSWI